MKSKLYKYDFDKSEKFGVIAGTDEVGRGPLAGPVVAAAVILDYSDEIDGIRDSKKLSEKKREELFEIIIKKAISFGVTVTTNRVIDEINILQASLFSMRLSIGKLKVKPNLVLVDGNQIVPNLLIDQETIVKGDSKSASIAAASIVAKVVHDRIMRGYDKIWPQYQFINNKGYGTKVHREAIKKYGLTRIHRDSFCRKIIMQTEMILD